MVFKSDEGHQSKHTVVCVCRCVRERNFFLKSRHTVLYMTMKDQDWIYEYTTHWDTLDTYTVAKGGIESHS